jgi:hypothetical protein
MYNTQCEIILDSNISSIGDVDWWRRDALYKLIVDNIGTHIREIIPITCVKYQIMWTDEDCYGQFIDSADYKFVANKLDKDYQVKIAWTTQS